MSPWPPFNARVKKAMIYPEGWLPVDCWCRREIVHVPRKEVLLVLTRSCGHPECKRPEMPA